MELKDGTLTRKWVQMKRAGLLRCVESNHGVESLERRDLPTTSGKMEVRSWLHGQPLTRMLNYNKSISRMAAFGRRRPRLPACSCLRCGVNSSFHFDFSILPDIVLRLWHRTLHIPHSKTLDIEAQKQNLSCTYPPSKTPNLEIIPVPIIRRPTPNVPRPDQNSSTCSSLQFQAFPPEVPICDIPSTKKPHHLIHSLPSTSSMPRTVHSPLR